MGYTARPWRKPDRAGILAGVAPAHLGRLLARNMNAALSPEIQFMGLPTISYNRMGEWMS